MTLWRLEWIRLVRTRRLVGLMAVYVFLGLMAPPLARYLPDIISSSATGDMTIVAPPARPVDGVSGYASNAAQIGLLVFVFVVAAALALDAQREMAVFLRTRVPSYRDLLLPRYITAVGAGAVCFVLGALVAWCGTIAWIGTLDVAGVVTGTALGVVYLAFVGALTAAFASRLDGAVITAVSTLGVALALGIVGAIGHIGQWLPSNLLSAMGSLAAGGGDPMSYGRSVVVTIVATLALLALAVRLGNRREL